jgi:hypothetical protein
VNKLSNTYYYVLWTIPIYDQLAGSLTSTGLERPFLIVWVLVVADFCMFSYVPNNALYRRVIDATPPRVELPRNHSTIRCAVKKMIGLEPKAHSQMLASTHPPPGAVLPNPHPWARM